MNQKPTNFIIYSLVFIFLVYTSFALSELNDAPTLRDANTTPTPTNTGSNVSAAEASGIISGIENLVIAGSTEASSENKGMQVFMGSTKISVGTILIESSCGPQAAVGAMAACMMGVMEVIGGTMAIIKVAALDDSCKATSGSSCRDSRSPPSGGGPPPPSNGPPPPSPAEACVLDPPSCEQSTQALLTQSGVTLVRGPDGEVLSIGLGDTTVKPPFDENAFKKAGIPPDEVDTNFDFANKVSADLSSQSNKLLANMNKASGEASGEDSSIDTPNNTPGGNSLSGASGGGGEGSFEDDSYESEEANANSYKYASLLRGHMKKTKTKTTFKPVAFGNTQVGVASDNIFNMVSKAYNGVKSPLSSSR